jgi:hypothetical protein
MLMILAGLFYYNDAAFSAEPEKKSLKINFINISEQDYTEYFIPLLPFQNYIFTRNYTAAGNIYDPSAGTVNFHAGNSLIEDREYFTLKSNSVDKEGNSFSLQWDISDGFFLDNRKNAALKFSSEMIFESMNNNINYVFTKKLLESDSIKDLKPMFEEGDDVTGIKGYEFNYSIKRSSSYYAWRTITEILISCGIGVTNYYMTKYENMVDWQYTYSWDDAKRKVEDGWYWDPNNFNTNTIYHLYAGMTYYQIARSNYYTIPESLLWTFGGSFFWEFVGEWREQVSLNDMIFTPMLGAVTGEAMIRLCDYMDTHMSPGPLRDIIQLVINPFGWINKKLDSANTGDIKVRLVFTNPVQAAIDNRIEKELTNR